MLYRKPTLFGMYYASRFFRETDDDPPSYEKFVSRIKPPLDLQNDNHAQALLEWLNTWGCRIAKGSFPALKDRVRPWSNKWTPKLPAVNIELVDLPDTDLDVLADAYEALLSVFEVARRGATTAAKALFAVRPRAAIAWDGAIRSSFKVQDDRQGYREMLSVSKREIESLIGGASHRGISRHDIPIRIGSPDRTLVRLLDEYHWVTITRRHQIPTCSELRQWVDWALPPHSCLTRRASLLLV